MYVAVFVDVTGRVIHGVAPVEGSSSIEPVAKVQALEDVKARSTTATGGHCASVEDRGGVAAVHDLMKALDNCFEEPIDVVGAGELEKRAEDLWGGERI